MVTLPTWDLIITLFFLLAVGYGLILGRERVIVTLIATYVGFAVATETGNALYAIFTGQSVVSGDIWIKSNLSVFLTKTILFAAIIILLSVKGEFTATNLGGGMKGMVLAGVYSFLNAGLIVSSLISFLMEQTRASLYAQSYLASRVVDLRNWWLLLPVVIMIAVGFFTKKAPAKEE